VAETIKRPFVALVEGWHEYKLIPALIRDRALPIEVDVFCYKGKDNLRPFLTGFVKAPGFAELQGLAILRDADANAAGAFNSVRDTLAHLKLPVPPAAQAVAAGPPRVVILILPGGGLNGMVEDMLLASVGGDAALPCVDAFLGCVGAAGVPGPANASKARAHAFLAAKPNSGLRLDLAALEGYFVLTNPALDPIQQALEAISA
jgi:hypothetical protein